MLHPWSLRLIAIIRFRHQFACFFCCRPSSPPLNAPQAAHFIPMHSTGFMCTIKPRCITTWIIRPWHKTWPDVLLQKSLPCQMQPPSHEEWATPKNILIFSAEKLQSGREISLVWLWASSTSSPLSLQLAPCKLRRQGVLNKQVTGANLTCSPSFFTCIVSIFLHSSVYSSCISGNAVFH